MRAQFLRCIEQKQKQKKIRTNGLWVKCEIDRWNLHGHTKVHTKIYQFRNIARITTR